MTAYNREKYIATAIESVLAQTFEDFELIIVDDCSQDGTVQIAQRYLTNKHVRVVINDKNLGQFQNRNNAARFARGRFIKYQDSDDLMYSHCLSTMVAPLVAEPRAGFALSVGKYWQGGPCPMLLTPRMSYQREFLGSGLFMGGPASAVFRAEVFRQLGGFPEIGVGSDYIFWAKACAQVNVILLPADLFWYRVHAGQELQSERAAHDYAIVQGEVWRMLDVPECPLDAEEREQAKRNWLFIIAKLTYLDFKAGRFGIARLRLRHAGLTVSDWFRYLRRPVRSVQAGTPLDEHGDFLIPDWSQFRLPEAELAEHAGMNF
jgi:glycosyltransferase involved in cell wall biosynthesis